MNAPLPGAGYAYMQLASPLATQAALSLDGAEFMGRTVKVSPYSCFLESGHQRSLLSQHHAWQL